MDKCFDLSGKTALVAGASSGLGRNFAKTLARHNAKVALAARRIDRLEETLSEIRSEGGDGIALQMDVAEHISVTKGFQFVSDLWGAAPDIVVANAGVAGDADATTLEMPPEEWRRVLDVDLTGVWHVCQAAVKGLRHARKEGSVIAISSLMGTRAYPGAPHYAAAKAGVNHLIRCLALEFANEGIRVNGIAPGFFPTDANRFIFDPGSGIPLDQIPLLKNLPMRRTGQQSELDGALMLLASSAGSFITGAIIPVDGGHMVSGF